MIYTYIGNVDSHDHTGQIVLGGGSTIVKMGAYADFSAGEYNVLSSRYVLQAGIVAGAVPAVQSSGSNGSSGTGGISRPNIGVLDVFGHSLAFGKGGDSVDTSYSGRVARMLAPQRFRNISVGGAVACLPTIGAAGDGGWGWILGSQQFHSIMPRQGWPGPDYPMLPVRDAAILHFGLNDLGQLGSATPRPFQEAMRNMISAMLTCRAIPWNDASWTFGGAWSTATSAGYWSGIAGKGFHYTSALNSTATLVTPAEFPVGRALSVVHMVQPNHDYTLSWTIDGVAQPDIRIQGSVLCDTFGANTSHNNQYVHRITGLSTGVHTIVYTLKTQSVAGSLWELDEARVEADQADCPPVAVVGLHRAISYASYTGYPFGPDSGTDPMNDAGVVAFNAALKDTLVEFPSAFFFDIDTIINKQVWMLMSDGLHPTMYGYAPIADALYTQLRSKLDQTAMSKVSPPCGPPGAGLFVGLPSAAVAPIKFNTVGMSPAWTNYSSTGGGFPFLQVWKDRDNQVHITGAIKNGSPVTGVIINLPPGFRPLQTTVLMGFSSAGAVQRWQIATNGDLTITNGGDATRSELPEQVYAAHV